jgi:hypothetical protein
MKILIIFFAVIMVSSCSKKLTANKKTSLQQELLQMEKSDQIAASHWEPKWTKYKDSTFSSNKSSVEKMFNQYGFLGFDTVGEPASTAFWLLVQHSDAFPEFQKRILKAMDSQVAKKNANPTHYALLFDRVQVNAGLKQKFGTQVSYAVQSTGKAYPKIGLIDSLQVDLYRKQYQLEPLKEYLNQMTRMHFEINKEHYLKIGVLQPDLDN